MKFRIHNRENDDSLVIEGETIEECREAAKRQEARRGWNPENCWSEELK